MTFMQQNYLFRCGGDQGLGYNNFFQQVQEAIKVQISLAFILKIKSPI